MLKSLYIKCLQSEITTFSILATSKSSWLFYILITEDFYSVPLYFIEWCIIFLVPVSSMDGIATCILLTLVVYNLLFDTFSAS